MDRMLGLLLIATVLVAWVALRRHLDGGWPVGAVVVLVAMLAFTAHELWWWRHEERYAAVTAAVHGGDGEFLCERLTRGLFSSQGYVGHVSFTADGQPIGPAFLAWDTCSGLRRWSEAGDPADLEAVMAAHTLVHEAAHLAGVTDEADAECIAIVHDQRVWVDLGASPEAARAAFDRYLTEIRPRMPPQYRRDCSLPPSPTAAVGGTG